MMIDSMFPSCVSFHETHRLAGWLTRAAGKLRLQSGTSYFAALIPSSSSLKLVWADQGRTAALSK